MRRIIFCFAILFTHTLTAKDDPKYPVSSIPEEMKKGMYAVIRDSEERVEILDGRSSTHYIRTVVTILNANAKREAYLQVFYDKQTKIKTLHATVYNAMGLVIKKLKNEDISDQSAYDGFSLFSDNRIKSIDLSQTVYPYTVEFEYEIEKKFLYDLTRFILYTDDEISIQQSSLKIIFPKELKPRYKARNAPKPEVVTLDSKRESFVWSFTNFTPPKFEPMSDFASIVPMVLVAPNAFEYSGYAGNMSTWEEYGKWQSLLNAGRDKLPPETEQKVAALTKDSKTIEQKTRVLYEYLQNKTRYVSIQLGIGGFQPFEASLVDKTGYGDCKALSNYMVSLLKASGVKGYYVCIYGGDNDPDVVTDFPSDQSNHIVVAVPNEKDTIWLECTNQVVPFGYQGKFTGDRYGLMITEQGGKLVKTTSYPTEVNTQSRRAEVFVEATGDAKAKVKTVYAGLQYEEGGLDFFLGNQYDDQKKWIQKNTQIPNFDINSFTMKNVKERIPSAIVNLDLTLRRFATVSGKRIFLSPNLMNRSTFIPEKVENRKTNVVRGMGYIDTDTVQYHLPEGIYPEFLPEPVKIKSRFGEYEATFKVDGDGLIYIRKMRMNKGEFPAESYNELIDFFRGVSKADNVKMVFMSKT